MEMAKGRKIISRRKVCNQGSGRDPSSAAGGLRMMEFCSLPIEIRRSYFDEMGSGMASPSLRGSEAPKFTLVEKSRRTAWPPPMSEA